MNELIKGLFFKNETLDGPERYHLTFSQRNVLSFLFQYSLWFTSHYELEEICKEPFYWQSQGIYHNNDNKQLLFQYC